ncbi:MAG: hypothetical protein ACTSQ8_25915 [Candidatus Helarchaeota archaeon]
MFTDFVAGAAGGASTKGAEKLTKSVSGQVTANRMVTTATDKLIISSMRAGGKKIGGELSGKLLEYLKSLTPNADKWVESESVGNSRDGS